MNKAYFYDFHEYGDLYLEKTLYEFEGQPITFVCLDQKQKRYLCHCICPVIPFTWLVSRITNEELCEILWGQKTVFDYYRNSKSCVVMAEYNDGMKYSEYSPGRVPDSELPDRVYHIDYRDYNSYIETLKNNKVVIRDLKPQNHSVPDARKVDLTYHKVGAKRKNEYFVRKKKQKNAITKSLLCANL